MIRMHPKSLGIAATSAMIFAFGTVGSAIVLGRITDDVVIPAFEEPGVTTSTILWGVVALAAITVIRIVGTVGRRFFGMLAGEQVQRTYRQQLGEKYLRLPLAWHQKRPTGELLAHVDNDAEMATQVLMPLPFTIGVFFLTIFSGISLVLVDPLLAAIAFALFPLLAFLNRLYSKRIEVPAARVQADVGDVSSVAHESFDGALVVKTLGRAKPEGVRFGEKVEKLRKDRVEVGFLTAAFDTALDVIPNLGIVAVVLIGTYRIEAGAMTPGELVQVASLFSVLSFPMRVFGFFLTSLPPSVVAHDRLDPIFNSEVPPAPENTKPLPDGALSVGASGVVFAFDAPVENLSVSDEPVVERTQVLSGVDLEIAPGETIALVGSTGAGKSTLCSILCGLLPPEQGEVHIGGVAVDSIDALERTDAVALVFQESFLFADSVRSNIDLNGTISDEEVRAAAKIARADAFVQELPEGYDTVVGERGVTLSGGQRQRVALARALIRKPRLLVLDDATSAVDAEVEQQILANLRASVDATVLVVAQRVSTIELADRVLYFNDGRIIAAGTHTELLAHPGYESLVRAYEQAA